MSYPASMMTVHLTADFRRLVGGDALEAQVWISSPSALVSPTDDVIVPRANELVGTTSGLLDVVLPVADDAEWGPQGFEYLIRATFATGVQMAWLVKLLTAQGAEQDLADYGVEVPYPDSSGPFEILYPSAPAGGGGGAGVDSFAGRTGAVVPATNDYSVAQINGLSTALGQKADATATSNALAQKADAAATSSALALKANTSDVNTALGLKADTSTVNSALALKADTTALAGYVPTSRTITAGTGLTGSGDLSANRTLAVAFGTSGTTAAAGNDNRLSDARTPVDNTVSTIKVQDGAITVAKMANLAARTVLGNATGSAAAPTAITVEALRALLETVVVLTDAATIATDAAAGGTFEVTLLGSRTLGVPGNPAKGMRRLWRFVQGGSGGFTITLNAIFEDSFVGGPPVLAPTAGFASYMLAYYTGTRWDVLAYAVES